MIWRGGERVELGRRAGGCCICDPIRPETKSPPKFRPGIPHFRLNNHHHHYSSVFVCLCECVRMCAHT
ncbi:hypothetical protein LZ30DRAFT_719939 [Colletotrichum cereale]|nr:hypothetical protein LZ30DRAFT_719939 [Colletotrichum cereale]